MLKFAKSKFDRENRRINEEWVQNVACIWCKHKPFSDGQWTPCLKAKKKRKWQLKANPTVRFHCNQCRLLAGPNSFVQSPVHLTSIVWIQSTDTTVAQLCLWRWIHLQPLIRSQVTGVRYYNEAKAFFKDVFVWIVKPQWKKILVTKCAIFLLNWLFILLSRNKMYLLSYSAPQYWLVGRGYIRYKLGSTAKQA